MSAAFTTVNFDSSLFAPNSPVSHYGHHDTDQQPTATSFAPNETSLYPTSYAGDTSMDSTSSTETLGETAPPTTERQSRATTDASRLGDSQVPSTDQASTPINSTHNGFTINITNASQFSMNRPSTNRTNVSQAPRRRQPTATNHSWFTRSGRTFAGVQKSTAGTRRRPRAYDTDVSYLRERLTSCQTPVESSFASSTQSVGTNAGSDGTGDPGLLSRTFTSISEACTRRIYALYPDTGTAEWGTGSRF